jgi:hypothetical protein
MPFGIVVADVEGPSTGTTVGSSGAADSKCRREDRKMSRSRRAIGIFTILAVLATGWALEKSYSYSHAKDETAVIEPTKASTELRTSEPSAASAGGQPAPADANWEYDRSDLLLSQG